MGHGGFGVSVSNGGKLPPSKFLGNSTTSRGHSGGANIKGHSGGAGSRGHSESTKLDRIHGEGELGGTSGDEGELGGTGWRANSASSWDGAASGADSASSWDGAASGADSASSWDGAASGADSASSWDGAASGADSASSWDGAASGADSVSSWDGAASDYIDIDIDSGKAVMMGRNSEAAAILWQGSWLEVITGALFSFSTIPTVKGEPLSCSAISI